MSNEKKYEKARVLVEAGATIESACKEVGMLPPTYAYWKLKKKRNLLSVPDVKFTTLEPKTRAYTKKDKSAKYVVVFVPPAEFGNFIREHVYG